MTMPRAVPLRLTRRFERALALLAATSLNAAVALAAIDQELEVGQRELPTDTVARPATGPRVLAPPPAMTPASSELDPWLRRPGFGGAYHR
jgi:hypothetical protein